MEKDIRPEQKRLSLNSRGEGVKFNGFDLTDQDGVPWGPFDSFMRKGVLSSLVTEVVACRNPHDAG